MTESSTDSTCDPSSENPRSNGMIPVRVPGVSESLVEYTSVGKK